MNKTFGQNDPEIFDYVYDLLNLEDKVLEDIKLRSDKAGLPPIQVGAADARHLEILARSVGAKKIVEIGTLGGYSGVCLARALPQNGKLFTFEYEPHHAAVATESFRRADLTNKVQIYVGEALKNLTQIESEGPFDLVFIDADKVNYPAYGAWALRNLRMGGLLMADNTFAWGHIAEKTLSGTAEENQSVEALRDFNKMIAQGKAFRTTMLPTGEGLTLAVKVNEP